MSRILLMSAVGVLCARFSNGQNVAARLVVNMYRATNLPRYHDACGDCDDIYGTFTVPGAPEVRTRDDRGPGCRCGPWYARAWCRRIDGDCQARGGSTTWNAAAPAVCVAAGRPVTVTYRVADDDRHNSDDDIVGSSSNPARFTIPAFSSSGPRSGSATVSSSDVEFRWTWTTCGSNTYTAGCSNARTLSCPACRTVGSCDSSSYFVPGTCTATGTTDTSRCAPCTSHSNFTCPSGYVRTGTCGDGQVNHECLPSTTTTTMTSSTTTASSTTVTTATVTSATSTVSSTTVTATTTTTVTSTTATLTTTTSTTTTSTATTTTSTTTSSTTSTTSTTTTSSTTTTTTSTITSSTVTSSTVTPPPPAAASAFGSPTSSGSVSVLVGGLAVLALIAVLVAMAHKRRGGADIAVTKRPMHANPLYDAGQGQIDDSTVYKAGNGDIGVYATTEAPRRPTVTVRGTDGTLYSVPKAGIASIPAAYEDPDLNLDYTAPADIATNGQRRHTVTVRGSNGTLYAVPKADGASVPGTRDDPDLNLDYTAPADIATNGQRRHTVTVRGSNGTLYAVPKADDTSTVYQSVGAQTYAIPLEGGTEGGNPSAPYSQSLAADSPCTSVDESVGANARDLPTRRGGNVRDSFGPPSASGDQTDV